jgi:prepilin-type N-terminal cleavage/methylation domain-containing protein
MRRNRRARGYSLMEITVVVAIVSVILLMAYTMIEDAARTAMFVEARNDLPVLAQGAVNDIQAELFQAKTIFDADLGGVGPGYLAAVQLPAGLPLLQDSQLPLMNAGGDLVPDTATRYTGNCLLLARQLTPVNVSLGGGQRLLADVYQFELIYLTKRTSGRFSTSPFIIDMIRAKSEPMADYYQLAQNGLTPQQTQAANADLLAWVDPVTKQASPIKLAWNPGQPIASAFYDVKSGGTYTAVARPVIDLTYSYGTMLKGLMGGRISGAAQYSVGFLPSATTKFPVRDAIPRFALFDPQKPLFPSGAEFLIVGPAGQRRAFARVVLFANYSAGKMTSKAVEVTTAAR